MTTENSVVPIWPVFVHHVLRVLDTGVTLSRRELTAQTLDAAQLSEEARAETLESGRLRATGRVGWAITHLKKAGCIERASRAHYRITAAGKGWLAEHAEGLGDFASAHQAFAQYWASSAALPEEAAAAIEDDLDPAEQIENGVERLHASVADDLLTRIHNQEPVFFEQAVLDLLMAMGYGGTEGKATRTQLSNDGGIDGVVDQDALGLSRIYVQAKRYAVDATIGRPAIQGFVGALHGNQANQGVFITTARFSSEAEAYATTIPTRVVLIDGKRLAALMIRYGVGVQVRRTVQIVEVDEDFFE